VKTILHPPIGKKEIFRQNTVGLPTGHRHRSLDGKEYPERGKRRKLQNIGDNAGGGRKGLSFQTYFNLETENSEYRGEGDHWSGDKFYRGKWGGSEGGGCWEKGRIVWNIVEPVETGDRLSGQDEERSSRAGGMGVPLGV